jgi:hypothetical protein
MPLMPLPRVMPMVCRNAAIAVTLMFAERHADARVTASA